MVGTTRARVNFFMDKFMKLGFIDYNGGYDRCRRRSCIVEGVIQN
jgi:hypothetical protein